MTGPTPLPRLPVTINMAGMPLARLPDGRPMRMGKVEEGSTRGEGWALVRAAIILLLTMGVIAVLIA